MKRPFHLVFAGGGTGGHLFPGLAVAEQLAAAIPRLRITFAGSGKEFERRQVAAAGFDYSRCPAGRLPRGAARGRLLRRGKPRRLSGRQAVPQGAAGRRRGRAGRLRQRADGPGGRPAPMPLVLLEQNVVPGRATRWLAPVGHAALHQLSANPAELRHRCPLRSPAIRSARIRPSVRSLRRWTAASSSRGPPVNSWCSAAAAGPGRSTKTSPARSTRPPTAWPAGRSSISRAKPSCRPPASCTQARPEAVVAPFWPICPPCWRQATWPFAARAGRRWPSWPPPACPPSCCPIPMPPTTISARMPRSLSRPAARLLLDERELPGRLDDHLAEGLGLAGRGSPIGGPSWPRPCAGWPGRGPRPTWPPWSGRLSAVRPAASPVAA